MSSTPARGPVPGADRLVLRGYGPFAALAALILAMALLAPTIAPEREVTTRSRPATAVSGPARGTNDAPVQ